MLMNSSQTPLKFKFLHMLFSYVDERGPPKPSEGTDPALRARLSPASRSRDVRSITVSISPARDDVSLSHRWYLLAYLLCCQLSPLFPISSFPYGESFLCSGFLFVCFFVCSWRSAAAGFLQIMPGQWSEDHGGKSSGLPLRWERTFYRRPGELSTFLREC